MIDAYTHLDMAAPDPIEDLRLQMANAGINHALIVETWAKDNYGWLGRLIASQSSQFRVALCFRPEDNSSPPVEILEKTMVAVVRVKTGDLRRLDRLADFLETSGKWLLPHAENGIKTMTDELIPVVKRHPGLHVYVPHLGWPRRDKQDDKDWEACIVELSQLPSRIAGISAIAHFSQERYPHKDVEPFAARLLEVFGQRSVVTGTDYPLIENGMYTKYLGLAQEWIGHVNTEYQSDFEEALFGGAAKPFPEGRREAHTP